MAVVRKSGEERGNRDPFGRLVLDENRKKREIMVISSSEGNPRREGRPSLACRNPTMIREEKRS